MLYAKTVFDWRTPYALAVGEVRAAMLPVVATMTQKITIGAGVSSGVLWWALAFGAGFGGNGTYIGSSASVIAVRISEDPGKPISFWYWLKNGTVVMLMTLGVAALDLSAQALTSSHIPLLPG